MATVPTNDNAPGSVITVTEPRKQPLPPIIEATEHAVREAIGLFYGGFMFVGIAVGGLCGFLVSGGSVGFMLGGWVDVLIGSVLGAMFGLGCGEITNAVLIMRRNKNDKDRECE
ncbi:hypothetical protein FACS1894133_7250 [Clostridia bacterium]|nr:hypothetical protein FACS1894133_7250 [Clostridia bacterium]